MIKGIFMFIVIAGFGFSIYLTLSYIAIPDGEKGSYASYVKESFSTGFGLIAKETGELPSEIIAGIETQEAVQKKLMNDTQKALEYHYAVYEQYPGALGAAKESPSLPQNLEMDYQKTKTGYILTLINKRNGQELQRYEKVKPELMDGRNFIDSP